MLVSGRVVLVWSCHREGSGGIWSSIWFLKHKKSRQFFVGTADWDIRVAKHHRSPTVFHIVFQMQDFDADLFFNRLSVGWGPHETTPTSPAMEGPLEHSQATKLNDCCSPEIHSDPAFPMTDPWDWYICSIFTYTWLIFMVIVSKWTIHGSYGFGCTWHFFICFQGSNKHKQSRTDPLFAGHPSSKWSYVHT